MGIISWIFWGLFVGAIARFLLPNSAKISIVYTILLGVAGSVVGGIIATQVIDIADSDEFDFGSFLIAVATSALILWIAGRFIGRGDDKSEKSEKSD